ncbi:DUF3592 domain-containing protein [Pseudarthrobacter sp. N5]|uniref:DUF3592 domain-containing protein n=1 Tax=Pseudarthrobacter sp. N5 TaxID=3418416 RepID=UPI003CF91E0C
MPTARFSPAIKGWVQVPATVTGNFHGTGSSARQGGHRRFAPSYEFVDAAGRRRLGQADVYGPEQEIIGTLIPVLYNPANPAESTRTGFLRSRGRLAVGLILVVFGAAGITMFVSVLF